MNTMTKEQLEALIQRMNMPREPEFHGNVGTTAWNARHEAEKLSDECLFPHLEEIITENMGEDRKDIRQAAYFIYAKIMKNSGFREDAFQFLLHWFELETDERVIWTLLTLLWGLKVLPDTRLDPLLEYGEKNVDSSNWRSFLWAIKSFAEQGNQDAINAYPLLEKIAKEKRKTPKEEAAEILKGFGILTEDDLDNLPEDEGGALYETLKAGVIEEYDISWEEVCELLDEIIEKEST